MSGGRKPLKRDKNNDFSVLGGNKNELKTQKGNGDHMMKEQIMAKMMFILPGEEGKRCHVSVNDAGQAKVMLDLHQLDRYKAARLLNNVITIIREPFTLEVIHGYNRGTVLRTYVNTELKNKRIKNRYICRYNEGVTVLNIA